MWYSKHILCFTFVFVFLRKQITNVRDMGAPKNENLERLSDKRVDRIREVMNDRKMTIQKLADKSGLSYAHTNKILNGRMPLKPNLLEKIAIKGLGLPLSFFEEVTIESNQKPKTSKTN